MKDLTKLMLSSRELEIAGSAELILTKQHIINTAQQLLSNQVSIINSVLKSVSIEWPQQLCNSIPRIYKGENYKSLPYVIMDYPAVFGKENIFTLRTMFWWGNFFSVTLHLSGSYKEMFSKNITDKLRMHDTEIFICVNKNQWEHHFHLTNYVQVSKLESATLAEKINSNKFIKLAMKFPVEDWNNAGKFLEDFYKKMASLLED